MMPAMAARPKPPIQPIALTMSAAARSIGVSPAWLRALIAEGRGPTVRYLGGSKRVIMADELVEWMRALPTQATTPKSSACARSGADAARNGPRKLNRPSNLHLKPIARRQGNRRERKHCPQ